MNRKENVLNPSLISGVSYSVMIVLYLTFAFVFQLVLSKTVGEGSLVYIALNFCYASFAIVLVLVFKKLFDKKSILKSCGINAFKFNDCFAVLILVAGMILGFSFINLVISKWLTDLGIKYNGTNITVSEIGEYFLYFFVVCLLPAFCEEIFFRGSLCFGEEKRCGVLRAVTLSFLFALFHFSLFQFAYQFIFSFFLFLLADKTKSVIPCVSAHFLNNLTVLTLTYLNLESVFYEWYYILIGCSLIVSFLIWVFYKREKSEKDNGKAWLLLGASMGIAVSIAVIVLSALVVK